MFNGNKENSEIVKEELYNLCKLYSLSKDKADSIVTRSIRLAKGKHLNVSSLEIEKLILQTLTNANSNDVTKVRSCINKLTILNNDCYSKLLVFLKNMSTYNTEKRFNRDRSYMSTSKFSDPITASSMNSTTSGIMRNNSAIPAVMSTPRSHKYQISNELTEYTVIGDVLYIIMGVTGQYMSWDSTRQCLALSTRTNASLSNCMYVPVCKLVQCGVAYCRIKEYVERGARLDYTGVVCQGLCAALNDHMKAYINMVSDLQSQYRSWTLDMESRGGEQFCGDSDRAMTLERLLYALHDPGRNLMFLVGLVEEAADQKGGQLATTIYAFLLCGDPQREKLVRNLLLSAMEPFYEFIRQWIYDGILEEHQEFFVALNTQYDVKCQWTEKYGLKKNLIPSFITEAQAKKILLTGKSINFLREVCREQASLRVNPIISKTMCIGAESMINQDIDRSFENMINTVYTETSQHLLKVMYNKFQLMQHFTALRKFMLHGQGDFILRLIELIGGQLSRPGEELHTSSLDAPLLDAVRTTNAQFCVSNIINRVSINLLKMSEYETGWDVFTLRYEFQDVRPLFAFLNQLTLNFYTRAFIHLFRSRRVQFILNSLFKRKNSCPRSFSALPEVRQLLVSSNTLIMAKTHFVSQIQYYINFEVLECSWKKFMDSLKRAHDLDGVINHHSYFLSQVTSRCMLDENSRDLLTNLRTIYDLIITFEDLHDQMFRQFQDELASRQRYQDQVNDMQKQGKWGVNNELENKEMKRKNTFINSEIFSLKQKLKAHHNQYESQVGKFLTTLCQHKDPSLRGLYANIDFNGQYKNIIKAKR